MKFKKNYEWDREKKIHKVEKGTKVDKHKKTLYNAFDEEDLDYDIEHHQEQVVTSSTNIN